MRYNWQIREKKNKPPRLDHSHPVLRKILETIEIEEGEFKNFLNPSTKNLHSHLLIPDIEKAAQTILKAIEDKKKIIIYGDFDVDGVMATSILWDYLARKLQANVQPIIPSRFTEGYSLSKNSIERILENGGELVITVDCGIKDVELIKSYPQLDFIITDHHSYPVSKVGEKLDLKAENLKAIVHPQHPKSKYPFKNICGAAVAWKLICALEEQANTGEDVGEYLKHVGIATVTDVMPLINENRVFVAESLKRLRKCQSNSFKAVFDLTKIIQSELEAYHYGFVIGPRINAAGRLEDALDAVRLFCTEKREVADHLINKLDKLNTKRQEITRQLFEEVDQRIGSYPQNQKLFFETGEDWPEGILGLVAGKIQEKYNKPVLIGSHNKLTGFIKGSARSLKKYNVTKALESVSELLERFGGHAQAAGFTLKEENYEELSEKLIKHAGENLLDEDLIPKLDIVCELSFGEIDESTVEAINLIAPFGFGNPKPKFLFRNTFVTECKPIGKDKNHLKLGLESGSINLQAIGFSLAKDFSNINPGDKIDVVGTLGINEWNGNRNIQIEIKDMKIL